MIPGQLFASISPFLISKERSNIMTPVTLRKYVAEYEQIWKSMDEFLSKFKGRGIKIDRVN